MFITYAVSLLFEILSGQQFLLITFQHCEHLWLDQFSLLFNTHLVEFPHFRATKQY